MVSAAVVVMMPGETSLLEILRGRDLSAIGRVLELGCQVVQIRGLGGIATSGSRLRGLCQIVGDLSHNLVELRRVLLLYLLQLIHEAGSGGQTQGIGLLRGGRNRAGAAGGIGSCAVRLEGARKQRGNRVNSHAELGCKWAAN